MTEQYDAIIVGSGAGGGTLALKLAEQNKRVLLIERGDYLPREKENWNPESVFVENRYHTNEQWLDKDHKAFSPGTGYYVGGNTKVYGAALLRLRKQDFSQMRHFGGISPAWPIPYEVFQPYYLKAEELFCVHGKRHEDPTEPPEDAPYFFPPVSHEPFILDISEGIKKQNLHPFHLPLGICLNEENREKSPCIRCDTCDGYPCLVHAKADAHVMCVAKALEYPNVALYTNTKALHYIADQSGTKICALEINHKGKIERVSAKIYVTSCGAVNSAALLLRSKHPKHPHGIGNNNDLVGRNYMCHLNTVIIAVSQKRNPVKFQKTIGLNDYYFNAPDSQFPLGHIQLLGKVKKEMLAADAPAFAPGVALEFLADHCVGWWITSEDLPDLNNRVTITPSGDIQLSYTPNNLEAHERLLKKLKEMLSGLGSHTHIFPNKMYLSQQIPLGGVAHQAGTLRFGKDPKTSVLDLNCKVHGVDNLYAVDASFIPAIGAVNPALTIIANAIRVSDVLKNIV